MTDADTEQALKEARGPYVGPCTREEALEAIRSHTTGPVIVDYPERGFGARRISGWAVEVGAREGSGVFVLVPQGERHVALSTGVLYPSAAVLDLSRDEPPTWAAERFIGGLEIHFTSDVTIRLVFWHFVRHVTESGDVAPGFGPFDAAIEEE